MVFLLALFGMVCWGIAPIFAKAGLKNVSSTLALSVRTMIAAFIVISWTVFSGNLGKIAQIPYSALLLIGTEALLATLVGDLAYFAAVKRGDVSLVTIIMSSSPLVTIIAATIFLGEQMTLMRIIGACLIICGIVVVTISGSY